MNKTQNLKIFAFLFLVLNLNLASAVIVDAGYTTLYPGQQGKITLNIENNKNFDIEEVSVALVFDKIPFSSIGSSEKDVDDIDEDDDDSISFTLIPSTDIIPGDYEIPYIVRYVNANNNSETFEKEGSFGIRVSAKTDLDFTLEMRDNAIVGQEGRISLEIINQGLGEIKSVSIEIFPQGFELLSKEKVFIGTIDADDTDLASFDVIYQSTVPTLSAKITYKDFDNNEKSETINIPFNVYTREQALERGLIKKDNTFIYIGSIIVLLVIWFIWRRIRKKRKTIRR